MSVRIHNLPHIWRRLTLKKVVRRLRRVWSFEREERVYFMLPADALQLPAKNLLHKDCWEDLSLYRADPLGPSKEERLQQWRGRFARGEHSFTLADGGELVVWGWIIERQARAHMSEVHQDFDLPPNSAVLYDFYVAPGKRQSAHYQAALLQALRDAALVPGTEQIIVSVDGADEAPRWWVERMGFQHFCSLYYSRTLWWSKTWRTEPAVEPKRSTPV